METKRERGTREREGIIRPLGAYNNYNNWAAPNAAQGYGALATTTIACVVTPEARGSAVRAAKTFAVACRAPICVAPLVVRLAL